MPSRQQAEQAIWICQFLSNAYRPINIFRYDVRHKTIYIQAGTNDDIAVIIEEDGNWEFVVKPDLSRMTNSELRQYMSENRNNDEAFSAALGVILSRRDPNAPVYSSPSPGTSFKEAVDEITAIFEKHLEQRKNSEA